MEACPRRPLTFYSAVKDRQDTPMYFDKNQLESFKDPVQYLKYRKELEDNFFRGFESQLVDSDVSKNLRSNFIEAMRKRTAAKPEIISGLIPDFPPNCRRLTPGPGYLEALCSSNLDLIQTPIARYVSSS